MGFEILNVHHIDIGNNVRSGQNKDQILITDVQKNGSSWQITFKISRLSDKVRNMLNENNMYCYIYLCPYISSTSDGHHWSTHDRGRKLIHKYLANNSLVWRIRVNSQTNDPYVLNVDEDSLIDNYGDNHDFSKFDPSAWNYAYTRYILRLANNDIINFDEQQGLGVKHWYSTLNSSELIVKFNFRT